VLEVFTFMSDASATLTCLGTGDGWPSADRRHSAYLYRVGQLTCLIDCGESVTAQLCARRFSPDLIDAIFLSHLHFDHIGGLFMLLQGFWVEARKKALTIHAPAGAIKPIKQLLNAACIVDELLKFQLRFEPLRPPQPVQLQDVRITPFATTHLARLQSMFPNREGAVYDAFSFVLETEHLRVGHSADIGAVEDLTPLVQQPLDLLVCELAHVEAEELFEFLRARPIKQIAFVHLSREYRSHFDNIRSRARQALGSIQVLFPEDGDEIACAAQKNKATWR
jgi:ribonuclease BN (tRNA processing enzyme)